MRIAPFVALLSLSSALAAAQTPTPAPAAPPAPDAQAKAVRDSAKKVIDKASGWTQGAMDWLAQKGSEFKGTADGWRDSAEHKLRSAVDDALAIPAAPAGLRLLLPAAQGAPDAQPLQWTSLQDGADKLLVRMVILVHGLDEPGDVWNDLAPLLRNDGHCVARFDYADDQPVSVSADELAAALKDLRVRGVRRVSLVTHSMGGLVARDVLTRPAFYAGDATAHGAEKFPAVENWIMLGAPNHGSSLARLRYIAEAREHLVRWFESDGKDPRLLLGFLKDGAGEAGADLLPGSPFLTDLNARPLPKGVRITNVVGTVTNGEREKLDAVLRADWLRKIVSEDELARMSRAMASLEDSLGDGIVSVDSARLEGVTDEVRVDATHRTLLKRPIGENAIREGLGESKIVPSGVPVVLERLKH